MLIATGVWSVVFVLFVDDSIGDGEADEDEEDGEG